jgi:hypothetical protein
MRPGSRRDPKTTSAEYEMSPISVLRPLDYEGEDSGLLPGAGPPLGGV